MYNVYYINILPYIYMYISILGFIVRGMYSTRCPVDWQSHIATGRFPWRLAMTTERQFNQFPYLAI